MKIRKLHQDSNNPNISLSTLSLIKKTWLYSLYTHCFKKISLTRRISIILWRHCNPIFNYLKFTWFYRDSSCYFSVVKLSDYVKLAKLPVVTVFKPENVNTPMPKVTPTEDIITSLLSHEKFVFPSIYVAELGNAQIIGGTNLVFLQGSAICHDLYDFQRDYTSEEMHERHLFDLKKRNICIIRKNKELLQIPSAAVFTDACSNNYAHWLTEVLPRIAVFCTIEKYEKVPVLVDDGLHSNIIESLTAVVGIEREIITVPLGCEVCVKTLYLTSVSGYVPFERRSNNINPHSHGIFSPSAFELIRSKSLALLKNLPHKDLPKNIYLRRTSKTRKPTNNSDIERYLITIGYDIIETEKLTFLEQVALFSNADNIIAPTGASLANMIFSKPKINIHILIAKFDATSYGYWQNIACSCGNVVNYVLGKLSNSYEGIHSDYNVDISLLKELDDV